MKNRWKYTFIPVPAMTLYLSLAVCGNSGDVAEDDWRTAGVVVGSDTVAYDGENAGMLVTVCKSSAALYRDLLGQVLFDSVPFPMNIPDAEQSLNAISFDDMDGNEESDVLVSFIHESSDATELVWIWDPVERYVSREDLPTVVLSGGDLGEYVGLWKYQGRNLWLRICDDAIWEFVNDQNEVIEYGTLWVDENGVTFHFNGNGDILQLDRTVNGDFINSMNNGTLLPVEGIQPQRPYSVGNGLEISVAVEMGIFLLGSGACSYSGLSDGYNTADCYWEITKNGGYTHDSVRELHSGAICCIPEDSTPSSGQQYMTIASNELYGFYTGMWLITSTTYSNNQRGDNYYLHTVNWQGNSYLIELVYSTNWQYNVDGQAQVLTKSYPVYFPEEYNGLVFAAEAQPGGYKDTARHIRLDSISPEVATMDIDTVDLYSSLHFSLCY